MCTWMYIMDITFLYLNIAQDYPQEVKKHVESRGIVCKRARHDKTDG